MTLPKSVVDKDHRLEQNAITAEDALMEHRWHWTLDPSNARRVSMREYAREVGATYSAIHSSANGWADWLEESGDHGTVITPSDHRELAKLGAEKKQAAKAIAKATGKTVTAVTQPSKRDNLNTVVARARKQATERGTTVEHEIDQVARQQVREHDERKRTHSTQFIKVEDCLGAAIRDIHKALSVAADAEFTDSERQVIVSTLGKMRALLKLVEQRVAGKTGMDWDAEFRKIAERNNFRLS